MSNLSRAVATLTTIRARMGLNCSDNKKLRDYDFNDMSVDRDLREAAYSRHIQHGNKSNAIANLRQHPRNPANATHSKANVRAYGSAVIEAGVGNCLELSCAVANQLGTSFFSTGWDLVKFGGGSDHIFVVIGPPPKQPNGEYPQAMSTWPVGSAVCDAWSDIACIAREYPANWKARMRNWNNIGLELPALVGHGFAGASSWAGAVDNAKEPYCT